MEKSYAVIGPDNRAINFVVWDGETPFDYGAEQGNQIVSMESVGSYGYGWLWDGATFIEPATS